MPFIAAAYAFKSCFLSSKLTNGEFHCNRVVPPPPDDAVDSNTQGNSQCRNAIESNTASRT